MRAEPREVTTPDGRTLVVHEAGAAYGPVIVVHNGAPASGLLAEGVVADAVERGARLLSLNRPGYAGSTRRPGRDVAQVAEDVIAVLDALEIGRCVTYGLSGGGPFALACAALGGDRVVAALTVSSLAPHDAGGLDFMAGMGEDNIGEFDLAIKGEEALRPILEGWASELSGASGETIADTLGQSLLSEADRAAMTPELAAHLARLGSDAVSHGVDGWLDDDLAYVRPWGFEVGAIEVPVAVWHGRRDHMVPPAHGEWLAEQVPGAEATFLDDEGHLLLLRHVGDVHGWLLAHC